MHTKIKGDIGELLVAADLLEKGWMVSLPISENTRYDLIIEKNGKIKRVQVKAVVPKNGAMIINCRSSNNWNVINYTKKDFEILAAVDIISKNVYYIPVKCINRRCINLRLTASKNRQEKNINLAKSFLKI
ncbi:MAG: group I intron-associated PD-(D/E)XK endonuclease [Candidatus Magasanikbacteria bacterium]